MLLLISFVLIHENWALWAHFLNFGILRLESIKFDRMSIFLEGTFGAHKGTLKLHKKY